MPGVSGFPALDVAIGLFFLYFVLSTVVSSINETIANVLGWRAKTLEDAIRGLVGDPTVKRGFKEWIGLVDKPGPKEGEVECERDGVTVPPDLTSELFEHWRIKSLVRDPESSARRRKLPSYLPPRAFSLAIAETLAKGAPPEKKDGQVRPTPWQQADARILAEVDTVLRNLPEGQTREVLQKAAANAGETLDGFRVQVERAFDDAMERASGWYKRKLQGVTILLGVVVTIGLNVDSVGIANRLWNDSAVRTAVAAKAVSQVNADPKAAAPVTQVEEQLQILGWREKNVREFLDHAPPRIPGWIITIAALSLGAPFWFDLLGRVASLRGSGSRPKGPPSSGPKR